MDRRRDFSEDFIVSGGEKDIAATPAITPKTYGVISGEGFVVSEDIKDIAASSAITPATEVIIFSGIHDYSPVCEFYGDYITQLHELTAIYHANKIIGILNRKE